jgi:uncharacterized protein YdaU (DUF1376 family)
MTTHYSTAEDFDWYKYYPAVFSVTTGHLSHVELGVYRRVLDHYWTSDNKLPRDVAEIAEWIGEKVFNWRRYGITAPAGFDNEEVTIRVVEHLLNEFFEQDEDGNWRHVWLDEYRKATDTQFQSRSKASKERVARQSRGSGGKFGKIITVPDGETPCLTEENTVPHGKATVEQSRETRSDGLDQLDQTEQTKADGVEADVANTLPPEEEFSGFPLEFSPESIPPRGTRQRWELLKSLESDPERANRFRLACSLKDAAQPTKTAPPQQSGAPEKKQCVQLSF